MNELLTQAEERQSGRSGERPVVLMAAAVEAGHLMLKKMFELNEVKVVEVDNAKAAINAALRERPDLILMDFNLPQLGGIATAREIRACAGMYYVPIVLLTACVGGNFRNIAFNAGCNDLLVKPVSYYAFYRMLKRYLFPFPSSGNKAIME